MPPKRKSTSAASPSAAKKSPKVAETKKSPKKAAEPKTKTTTAATTSSSSSFDLKSLLTDASWKKALGSELDDAYFKQIQTKLETDYAAKKQIFPPKEKIFNAFNLTSLDKVKVVILGQDPYHDDGQAEGLCFSVPDGMGIPPSLKNIFKEMNTDVPGFKTPSSGCLVKWAQQGVLLLNATLTVEAHTPNSHKSYGWQKFTDKVIQVVSAQCPFVVFILWGGFAHKKEKLIDASKHLVIKDAHPSPLSFNKFKGSKCFSRTNEALKKAGKSEVDWCL